MHAKGLPEPSRRDLNGQLTELTHGHAGGAERHLEKSSNLPRSGGVTMSLNQRIYGFTIRSNRQTRALYSKVLSMTSTTDAGSLAPAPWYVNYPAPKKEATAVSREDVLRMLCDAGSGARKDFVLIDLRRNDHEVRIGA